jgi:hypothetical protein
VLPRRLPVTRRFIVEPDIQMRVEQPVVQFVSRRTTQAEICLC